MTGAEMGVSPQRRALVVGLLLSVAAIAFEAIAVVTAMPAAADDLGNLDLYAWAFTAMVIGQLFAIVAAGRASDRFGPRAPLVVGFIVFAFGLVLAGAAPSMAVLVLGRFVQGLGGGTMNLAVMVVVARLFAGHARAVLMTWMSVAWMLPAFVGPVVAAWLATTFSWHWVFFSVLPLMALGGGLILGPLLRAELAPVPREADRTHGDVRVLASGLLVAVGAALLQLAGQQPGIVWVAVVGLGALVVGLPVLLPAGYRPGGSGLAATVNVRALVTGAFFGAETFLTLMLVRAEHLDLRDAGLVLTIGSIGWTAGSWLQSRRWLQLRRDRIITVGAAATALGLAAVALAAWLPGQLLWAVMVGWVIGGFGMGLQVASTSLVVMELSPPSDLGHNTSALQVGEALGSSVVAGLAGTIFVLLNADQNRAFGTLFVAMVAVAVIGLVFSLRIGVVRNHSVDNISTSR
ncbi:MAG: MFS transporter [Actinobacteria bacterium HGW-Actinobacteria-2]|nr:MAG: MFS transporter [Actinobacteria bacterium HGW-Actinobacteria-2]